MADKEHLEEVKSPIVMKVEAPPDENSANSATEENDSNENKSNDDSSSSSNNSGTHCTINNQQTSKVPVLARPKFGIGNPFAIKPSILSSPKLNLSNNSSKTILRPSKLSTVNDETSTSEASNNSNKKPFVLSPPQLNPFLKVAISDENLTNKSTNAKEQENSKGPAESSSDATSNKKEDAPKFVPLTGANSTQNNSTSNSATNFTVNSSGSFVFGQNLHERVIGENVDGKNNGIESSMPVPSSSCSNGTSSSSSAEALFSTAAVVNNDKSSADNNGEAKSLSEAAREYEESRAQKRKYEEVTVITGEENEENIMQISCKLFAFDQTTRNWQERGRGNLRLNDIILPSSTSCSAGDSSTASSSNDVQSSRLVVRSTGSLRVVMNTKIWAGMSVELASPKSIRLTAMDSAGIVKVFLVMANVKEIEKLHKLLKNRVDSEIKRQNKLLETTPTDNNSTAEPVSKRKPSDVNV
ncbi:ran-binding protein 3 [Chrysoperla carnea]|uniref:ran-binding protein 3 n=1 Tax=Chrysoperla carnea TaxID=189513 RepID=UPI001D07E2E3|nr:ran-binding protein 3 [Chrysoperla carnea]